MSRFALSLFAIGLLVATPALAQTRAPKDAAKSFTLDSVTPSSDASSTTPAPATTNAAPVAAPAPDASPVAAAAPDPAADVPIVTTMGPPPSLDTPIGQLIANPRTRAVLDKDLPGLSTDENLGHFQDKSLRQFQPLTGGQLTTALLAKVGSDLAALDSKAETTLAPSSAPPKQRRHQQAEGR